MDDPLLGTSDRAPRMGDYAHISEEHVRMFAARMHDVELGCVMGDFVSQDDGRLTGHGCIADHEAQARLLLGLP